MSVVLFHVIDGHVSVSGWGLIVLAVAASWARRRRTLAGELFSYRRWAKHADGAA